MEASCKIEAKTYHILLLLLCHAARGIWDLHSWLRSLVLVVNTYDILII